MNYFKTATILIVFVLLSYAASAYGQTINGISPDNLVFHLGSSGEDLSDDLWNDRSGSGNHFNVIGTPSINEDGVLFDGDDHFELHNISELHTDSLTWIIEFDADENYRDGILLRTSQNDGSNLPSGSYFYTVQANGQKTTKQITLVR